MEKIVFVDKEKEVLYISVEFLEKLPFITYTSKTGYYLVVLGETLDPEWGLWADDPKYRYRNYNSATDDVVELIDIVKEFIRKING